jgi:nucleotide-binding universal stress UspA family protein
MPASLKRILVPVDGSPSAARAAALAAELADKHGASITLLHVHALMGVEMLGLRALSRAEIEDAKQSVAARVFRSVARSMKGVTASQRVTSAGDPAAEIIALARKLKSDLIVMGSRGFSPVKSLLLGSVSQKVLQHAPCAVAVVR